MGQAYDGTARPLALIGLANIAGSLMAGFWVNRYRSKMVLFWIYGSRAVLVLAYLAAQDIRPAEGKGSK